MILTGRLMEWTGRLKYLDVKVKTGKMLIFKTCIWLVLLFGAHSCSGSNMDSLLQELESELVNYSESDCYLYETKRCMYIWDSLLIVPCSRPNFDKIELLFKEIYRKIGPSDYQDFLDVYDRYIIFFESNRNSYFAEDSACQNIKEEYIVFSTFESIIRYLLLVKEGKSIKHIIEQAKSSYFKKRTKHLSYWQDSFSYPSYYYQDFNNISNKHSNGFYGYHDFYSKFQNIEFEFIDELIDCDPCDTNNLSKNYWQCVYVTKGYPTEQMILKKYDPRVEEYFIKNIDCWILKYSLRVPLHYMNKYSCDSLAIAITNLILYSNSLKETQSEFYRRYIDDLTRKYVHLQLFINQVAKLAETDLDAAMQFLNYLDAEKRIKAKEYIKNEIPKDAALYRALNRDGLFHTSKD